MRHYPINRTEVGDRVPVVPGASLELITKEETRRKHHSKMKLSLFITLLAVEMCLSYRLVGEKGNCLLLHILVAAH